MRAHDRVVSYRAPSYETGNRLVPSFAKTRDVQPEANSPWPFLPAQRR